MDAIASVAFGLEIDSQNTKDDPFVRHAAMVFEPPSVFSRACMLFSGNFIWPREAKQCIGTCTKSEDSDLAHDVSSEPSCSKRR